MSILAHTENIALSIVKQLNLTNEVTTTSLSNIIYDSSIDSYEDIKLLSLAIKDYLKTTNISIQHSKVLNIISKALGYQNHHSLKNNYSPPVTINTIEINKDDDSPLKKIFILKDDFIKKFGIEKLEISHYIDKGHEFNFIYYKRGLKIRGKEKQLINDYLRVYNIKVYKTLLPLCKIKYQDLYRVAFNIVQHYMSFFKAVWKENPTRTNSYTQLVDTWNTLSYSNIRHENDFLLVDSFSTDLPWNIILNFLDYLFKFGTIEDVNFFEACLKQKH